MLKYLFSKKYDIMYVSNKLFCLDRQKYIYDKERIFFLYKCSSQTCHGEPHNIKKSER